MSKVTQRARRVKDDSPEGLFEVLGCSKGKVVSGISLEPMDFRGAVAMAAGYNQKPTAITAVVVPATKDPESENDKRNLSIVVFGKDGPFIAEGRFNKQEANCWIRTWTGESPVLRMHQRDAKRLVEILERQRIAEQVPADPFTASACVETSFGKEFQRWIWNVHDAIHSPFQAASLVRAIKQHVCEFLVESTGIDASAAEEHFQSIVDGEVKDDDDTLNRLLGLAENATELAVADAA